MSQLLQAHGMGKAADVLSAWGNLEGTPGEPSADCFDLLGSEPAKGYPCLSLCLCESAFHIKFKICIYFKIYLFSLEGQIDLQRGGKTKRKILHLLVHPPMAATVRAEPI